MDQRFSSEDLLFYFDVLHRLKRISWNIWDIKYKNHILSSIKSPPKATPSSILYFQSLQFPPVVKNSTHESHSRVTLITQDSCIFSIKFLSQKYHQIYLHCIGKIQRLFQPNTSRRLVVARVSSWEHDYRSYRSRSPRLHTPQKETSSYPQICIDTQYIHVLVLYSWRRDTVISVSSKAFIIPSSFEEEDYQNFSYPLFKTLKSAIKIRLHKHIQHSVSQTQDGAWVMPSFDKKE